MAAAAVHGGRRLGLPVSCRATLRGWQLVSPSFASAQKTAKRCSQLGDAAADGSVAYSTTMVSLGIKRLGRTHGRQPRPSGSAAERRLRACPPAATEARQARGCTFGRSRSAKRGDELFAESAAAASKMSPRVEAAFQRANRRGFDAASSCQKIIAHVCPSKVRGIRGNQRHRGSREERRTVALAGKVQDEPPPSPLSGRLATLAARRPSLLVVR